MSLADQIVAETAQLADPERAAGSARFFKTEPGQYGEGDSFIGVTVPQLRKVAKRFRDVDPATIDTLLASPIHEHRLIALFLLRAEFDRASGDAAAGWVDCYRDAIDRGCVDNWDLVDASADSVLGRWLVDQGDHRPLVELAADQRLWHRRVGIVGTFAFLKKGDPDATLDVVPVVIADRRDLIQKATGWMLRELGKRVDRDLLTGFLADNAAQMGRTALSYAIEHLDVDERAHYRSLR